MENNKKNSNKKTSPKNHNKRISDGNEVGYSIKLPSKSKGTFQEKRKKDFDRCYDFTSDHDINPPREARKKK